jgi:hypothetical protein
MAKDINLSAIPGKDSAGKNIQNAESEKDTAKKLKKRERDRAYYLKHKEKIKEGARNIYYRKQEEKRKLEEAAKISAERPAEKTEKPGESGEAEINDEKGGISISLLLVVLAGTAIIVFISIKRRQQVTALPTIQKNGDFDIGGGKIIKIKLRE